MRPLWIVAAVVCGVLAVASVASASMRDEVRSFVAIVASAPHHSTSPSPTPSETTAPQEADDETAAEGNHGAAVSQVATDEEAVATKTLANGKTITNHGVAVSAVAHVNAGVLAEASNDGKGNGNGKGGH